MSFPELNTTRLQLIEVTPEHGPALFHILSNEEVTRFYGMDPLREQEDALQIIGSFNQTFESRQGIRWGMVVRDSGTFIGTLGLNHLSLYSKKAEIGFELDPAHWRRGYAAEAIEAVLAYSFETLGLHRMGAVTFLENEASVQLLKRLGFEEEGVLRGYLFQGGTSHDGRIFSLLRPDYQSVERGLRGQEKPGMKINRMDHVSINVLDLTAATRFFVSLGFVVKGEWEASGPQLDRVTGLREAKTSCVALAIPDGETWLELVHYLAPMDTREPINEVNSRGLRHLCLNVESLDKMIQLVELQGYPVIHPVEQFGETYRLCYVRGPEGILLELAETIQK